MGDNSEYQQEAQGRPMAKQTTDLVVLLLFLIYVALPQLSRISNSKTKDLSSSLGF